MPAPFPFSAFQGIRGLGVFCWELSEACVQSKGSPGGLTGTESTVHLSHQVVCYLPFFVLLLADA